MRKIMILFTAIGLIALTSCKQETDVQALLQNAETRSQIVTALTGDHDFMTELMENMQGNDHAMQMMQGNKKMMGMMMKGGGMKMMMKDSMMTGDMMNPMMNDGKMMGDMMKMMHEKGMMSEDCMKSCMKMMGDKGMNMGLKGTDSNDQDSHNH